MRLLGEEEGLRSGRVRSREVGEISVREVEVRGRVGELEGLGFSLEVEDFWRRLPRAKAAVAAMAQVPWIIQLRFCMGGGYMVLGLGQFGDLGEFVEFGGD